MRYSMAIREREKDAHFSRYHKLYLRLKDLCTENYVKFTGGKFRRNEG